MAKTELVGAGAPDPDESRRVVVLTKPGDLLLVGNAAAIHLYQDHLKAVTDLFSELGIKVVFFADDIDVAKLPADG